MADVLSWEQVQKLEAELNEAVAAKADLEEQKRRLQATGIVESVEVTEIVPR